MSTNESRPEWNAFDLRVAMERDRSIKLFDMLGDVANAATLAGAKAIAARRMGYGPIEPMLRPEDTKSLGAVVAPKGGGGAVPAPAVPMEGEPGPSVLGAARASMESAWVSVDGERVRVVFPCGGVEHYWTADGARERWRHLGAAIFAAYVMESRLHAKQAAAEGQPVESTEAGS